MYLFVDWVTWFRRVCMGEKPFGHYPPWVYVPMQPLAHMDAIVGGAVLGLIGIAIAVRYLRWRALLMVTSAPMLISLVSGNIDSYLIGVFLLPLWAGLIIASCKPIVMAGWATRRILQKGAIHTLPFILLVAISLIVWKAWPLNMRVDVGVLTNKHSISFFPYSIGIGLLLLCTSDPVCWMVGTGMLSPYFSFYHLVPALAYYIKSRSLRKVMLVWIILWIYTLWRWY